MGLQFAHVFVIALTVATALYPQASTSQRAADLITDLDAYGIYSQVLQKESASSTGAVLLQQETVRSACAPHEPDPDWQSVMDNFTKENSRVRSLVPLLQLEKPYLLVPSAQIKADYGWVEMQRRSGLEMMQYFAVSAVGFDKSKTRAVVAINRSNSGHLILLERRDGIWGAPAATHLRACGWAV